MITREQVDQALETVLALMQREQELKERLLRLQMFGWRATSSEVDGKIAEHDGLISEIARLRHEEVLPILEQLLQAIAKRQACRVQ